MKFINKPHMITTILSASILLSACGSNNFEMPYTPDNTVSSYRIINTREEAQLTDLFAKNLCVATGKSSNNSEVDMSTATGAALFNLSKNEVLYEKNIYETLSPASLTKIMTALIALKSGSMDMTLTASANVKITESGAQVCGLKQGDQMTLSQALHVLLIYSANDAAVLIAEGIGGNVEEFAEMMNEEARAIGATNTHFVNPHGLSEDKHYTTVYDMYLILNEAIKYELFNEIIHMNTYTTSYALANGEQKELSINTTNLYLQGTHTAPEKVTVIGGKTGTTNAAGHCLALVSKDASGNPYISIILRSESRDELYNQMTDLLGEINN